MILNEELPRDLRQALERDAKERDVTLNDAAVRVLSVRLDHPWERAKATYGKVAIRFKLRVPDELHRLIRMEAAMREHTVRGVALGHLSDYYGTKSIDPHRRRRSE